MDGAPTLLATLGLGLSLGVLHALDADHLVAVATLVSERPSPRRAALIGCMWGLGHGAALGVVGLAVLVFHWAMPPWLAAWFELGVAAMLVGLGAQAVWRGLRRAAVHAHVHAHDGTVHAHRHVHVHAAEHARDRHDGVLHALSHAGRRPFLVGVVHGLAGSAALMLVVLGTIPSPTLGLTYLAVFGLGGIGSMAGLSALMSLPMAVAGVSLGALRRRLEVTIGVGGVAFGVVLGARLLGHGILGG